MPAALEVLQRYGLKLVGIHMHIGSGVDYATWSRCAVRWCARLSTSARIWRRSQPWRSLHSLSRRRRGDRYRSLYGLWSAARDQIAAHLGHSVKLEIEPGRFLVAEAGVLVSQVRSVKEMGSRHFVLIDAGFNDLMRPSMYGSYHHITALAADGRDLTQAPRIETVVAGPCANRVTCLSAGRRQSGDPRAARGQTGDYLVLHDTGAYGASMSSNYNSRPLLPEVLLITARHG